MSRDTIRTLSALKALAEVELGEASLALADLLDQRATRQSTLSRWEGDVRALLASYERLSRPGASVLVGALGSLTRQTMDSRASLEEAQAALSDVDGEVDAQRTVLQGLQARHEALGDILQSARKRHAEELEKRASLEREDLFLVRRHLMGEHA
ncbi:MAG: hypothetical protein QM742_10125 [Aquabacterium sp.]